MSGNGARGWALLHTTLRRQRTGLTVGVLVGLAYALAKILVPKLTQEAIDRGIVDSSGSLWVWSLLIMFAGMLAATCTSFRRWFAFRESRLTETTLREELFRHAMRLHAGYHDRAQTGALMSRATSDLMQIQAFVVMIPLTIANLVLIGGSIAILLTLDPVLTLYAVAPLPFINVLARRFSQRVHPAVMAVQQEQAQLAAVVEETVAGVRVVKGFGAESVQQRKLGAEAEDIRSRSLQAARIRSRFLPGIDVLPNLGLMMVLLVGGHRVIDGDLTIGELIGFNLYLGLMIWPLRMVGQTVAMGQRASAALGRVDDVLATVPEVADPPEPVPLPASGMGDHVGQVRFRDVRFGYDAGRPVLDGFDLDVAAGRSVAIVGATGSGKSTVARLLTRFYDVQIGSIEIDGIDVRDLALDELRRTVAIVFEDTFLFHDSVAANIAFARPAAEFEEIERAARLAGAHDFVVGLPDGYGTVLGERGYSLSGGQRQRIAIARAILADPRVLVLDDATSAVDPHKEHEIRGALATVMDGRTTFVIAHRPATIALADEVVLLDEGRVHARGPHEQLLRSSSRYREVLAALAAHDESTEVSAAAG